MRAGATFRLLSVHPRIQIQLEEPETRALAVREQNLLETRRRVGDTEASRAASAGERTAAAHGAAAHAAADCTAVVPAAATLEDFAAVAAA